VDGGGEGHSPCCAMLALRPAQSHRSDGVTPHISVQVKKRESVRSGQEW
jgi:hypothetical protein